jgi:hypothetical protein
MSVHFKFYIFIIYFRTGWVEQIEVDADVERVWQIFKTTLKSAERKHIPRRTFNPLLANERVPQDKTTVETIRKKTQTLAKQMKTI